MLSVVLFGLASLVYAQIAGPVNLQGTGGAITTPVAGPANGYIVHTFTAVGQSSFVPPPGVTSVDVLVVGGGGGGGRGGVDEAGGGGGAGGFVEQSNVSVSGPVTVTVGGGGDGGSGTTNALLVGNVGQDSVFASPSSITANGGGRGGGGSPLGNATGNSIRAGGAGGSGGGGGGGDTNGENGAAGAPSAGQGFIGGTGFGRGTDSQVAGGGGGGASAEGVNGSRSGNDGRGGAGGAGLTSTLFGGVYAGGGGGGAGQTPGDGGSGGGGNGSVDTTVPVANGTTNTGGGGGGSRNANAGNGGSGIVIVRYLPPTLRIAAGQQPGAQTYTGIALPTQPSVTLLTSAGAPVPNITVTASLESGSAVLGGTLTAVTNASGIATFTNLTLTGAVNSVNTLRLAVAGNAATNFVVTNQITIIEPSFFADISHPVAGGGACAPTAITITVRNDFNEVVTDFVGAITVTSAPGTGNWSNSFAAPGPFDNGALNDGIATYTFTLANAGVVQLGYTSAAGAYTFSVTGPDIDGVSNNGGTLNISACQFRIFHSGADGNVCRIEEVTIQVTNTAGELITGYTGTINLSTSGGLASTGTWSKTDVPADALGTLTPVPNLGSASYVFVAGDAGEIKLDYRNNQAGTANFNIVAANVAQPAGQFDPDLVLSSCLFRVTHSQASDLCSIEQVTITLVDSDGVTVTNYDGTVNLSTTTGFGTWVDVNLSDGVLTDPVDEDGNATYKFELTDEGTITLGFRLNSVTGPVNINVSDGVTLDARDPNNSFDRNIVIALCTFEIIHGLESNACSITEVTFRVRNSEGNIATDYLGTMRLTTNSTRGDWIETATSQGILTAPSGADVGLADYEFVAADAGQVTLRYYSTTPAILNFDADDGLITENGAFDPNLFYSGCFPITFAGPNCTNPGTSTTINIPAQNVVPELRSRMVLMATMQIGDSNTGTNAQFNGVNMTRIVRMENDDQLPIVTTEIWAIFDANLPAAAGTYTGVLTGGVEQPAICLLSVTGVEQTVPQIAPIPTQGPVNSSKYTGPVVNGRHNASTSITTSANNSFVFSVVANDRGSNASLDAYFYRPPQPASTLTGIWGGRIPGVQNDPPYRVATLQANANRTVPLFNNSGTKTAGSAGVLSSAGLLEVVEPFQSGATSPPTLNAHVVAAFRPLVAGAPLAESYVPVILHETFSGSLSYRAIGNSLRTLPSTTTLSVDPSQDCAMVNFATGTTATLSLPTNANIEAAYLYWAGSGETADIVSQVSFGLDQNEVAVVADEVFQAVGVTSSNVDFFAAYAEVTDIVTGPGLYRLKDLVVQTTAPWTSNGTCAGGWSLIAIYSDPDEHLRVVNLFHGFQPFQYSAFTLVPRNFRMATYDNNLLLPNGQVTHVTLEGDEQLANGEETLGIQRGPTGLDSTIFDPLVTSFNPSNAEFNSTITRPIYTAGPGLSDYIEFDSTAGINGDGYEIDFPGPDALQAGRTGNRIGSTWGFDVDTHYLSHTLLEDFAQPLSEAERITTRYSAGQDVVVLLSEVISIANFPIADVEVFISESGTFKVNGTGTYTVTVTNNGNGTAIAGEATGVITVAQQLPTGMTFANAADVSGTGWVCTVVLNPGAYTCTYNISASNPGGELDNGDSLPPLTVNVQVGNATVFPLQSNTAKATVRMLHSGGSCTPEAAGLIPDPDTCVRAPQFDNVNDTQGGTIDIDSLFDKSASNNNVASVLTTVTGVTTNLRMQKSVIGSLETNEAGQYLLTVTNLGPDISTAPFTITDLQPVGVDFISATGTNWTCSTISPTLSCVYNANLLTPLAVNASTSLTLNVDVTGGAGFNITNTAQVSVGTGNFDLVPSNNAATDITTIVGPPVASQERFLLSVSTPLDSTSIGGLNNFSNDDLIIYDPSTNIATMFFDDSEVNDDRIDDINAVHLLKNGHIIMSANGNSTIGSNNLVFDPWDLVRYDPILNTATLFLDGEAVFGTNYQDVNINGVYVMDDCAANNNSLNCSIVFTTTDGGQMPAVGGGTLTFTASDLVRYYRTGPNAGLAEIYLDGSDADVFGATEGNGNTDIDAFYLRVDPADPTAVLDVFVLSVDNQTGIIGEGLDPDTGTLFTRDDVTELDRINDTTENLFVGDVELGVFEPSAAERRLDALHLVEDGYVGHFSIRQEQGGSVCEAGVLRISKHDGLTHNRDLDYYGSVRITTSTNYGTWQLQTGGGVLTNNGNGEAIYTYASTDQGTVVLRLEHDQIATVNIGVTNGLVRELGSEDPNFSYDPELTLITWADEFGNVGFGNNNGSRNWAGNWTEVDGIDGTMGGGLGAGTGNVQIVNGRLSMTSSALAASNNIDPSLTRVFNLDAVPFSEDVVLRARYGHTALALSDSFVIEARGSGTDNWVVLEEFTNITADQTNSSISVSYNLSTVLAAQNPVQEFSSTSQVRFRINSGYELNRFFFIDDIEIETATDQCGFGGSGGVEHYAIAHSGFGISCVGTPITITAHDLNHDPIDAEGETITLSTSPAKGVWSRVLSGNGTLSSIASQSADNGQATYTFAPGEQTVQLLLNYTVPAGALQPVNINVVGSISDAVELEDPQLEIAASGLLFYNETLLNTTIPTQIAGKPSGTNPLGHLLTIQGVRSSDNDPMQCTPLFAPGQTLNIELAAECLDPALCIGGETMTINGDAVTLANDNGAAGINGTFTEVELYFITQPSGDIGATIQLNYSDVGLMQLHARYDIPFGFFGTPSPDNALTAPAYSGDFMIGSSNNFVVRPFGFEIDFPGTNGLDRRGNFPVGNFADVNSQASTSFAADSSGSPWRIAGAGFDTRVTAMGWQAADDTDVDGQPDLNANLHDNRVTPNFYKDTDGVADDYRIRLSVLSNQAQSECIVGAVPECGVLGVLTNDTVFEDDVDSPGSGLINMSYNEVGIIDLQAQLIDATQAATTYLGTDVIIGRVRNVGRFYPQRFVPSATSLLPRVTASCTPPSTFTYMDEPFGIAATLTARNLNGNTTVNYRGGFAKLDLYNELNLRAIEVIDPGDNTNRSSRLLNTGSPNGIPADLQPRWSAVTGGVLLVSGNLIYARATPADPDGPFEDLVIAFDPTDNDGVTLDPGVLNAEIAENFAEFFEIARHDFRYGRIQVDNAYGPETEPLDITFRVEYFDGVRFVTNTIDNCTVIASNQLDLLAGTYTGMLNDTETSIEPLLPPPLTSRFNGGLIQGTQAATNPTDPTFRATAPGDGNAGTVDIELDLSPTGLNLPWLQFNWPYEPVDDQDFNENPRATLEFGQFRSHDRVINWQEIYNGATTP